ncbi:helix-turn-helix domain-containing protein [Acinetobacter haemolyticus]|uniref:helix-turn-helix domain-containing protein n=1 Tax=Acinetobacter haemolyticus TaxID=29430 RepID=UPI001331D95B|nr:helix-turn-helix domain-containing protein [Acinetobacter haemolyticus]NAR17551.1 helix-turn-helix domain-containing protein [Acinetobacter haemolyticus]NAR37642.1 helix-turn-helix domain-containing protein [Acinetobacter haemolyticus]NAR48993.1 helix-turn-helix domain-containing protein [Acinetobacter haemolyticus]QHI18548.1 helix-turn-helix domain-containing protein [Acinetobacter haemolyticus]
MRNKLNIIKASDPRFNELLENNQVILGNNPIETILRTRQPMPNIKLVREKTGLTQAEFAARLFISLKTLEKWEKGKCRLNGPTIMLLRILNGFVAQRFEMQSAPN